MDVRAKTKEVSLTKSIEIQAIPQFHSEADNGGSQSESNELCS